ncbi:MAG: hypothetical protein QOE35_1090 [Actinomycetota bacterium]
MRRIAAVAALMLGFIGAVVLHTPLASASTTTVCDGDISYTTLASVFVPSGADCVLDHVTVKGDVRAQDAQNLDIFNSTVKGTVDIAGSRGSNHSFEVCNSTIGRDVRVANLAGSDSFELEGDTNESCGKVNVAGSVRLSTNQGDVEVSWTKIGADLSAVGNGDVEFEHNNVGADRRCSDNGHLDITDEPDTVHGRDLCTS